MTLTTKICKKCSGITFVLRKQKLNRPGKTYLTCQTCENKYQNLWKKNNKEKINLYNHKKHQEKKLFAISYLGNKCKLCSGIFPSCVYDFHHRDPKEKDLKANSVLSWGNERIMIELDKCDLLCANCHRITHWGDKESH